METKDYEIILDALKGLEEKSEEVNKLIKKIELFNQSDKLRLEYQENMEKIGKEINELINPTNNE